MGMDLLLLVTVGFFAILAGYGLWPAVIAAVPLLTMLYFGLRSSPAFFLAELLAMVLAVAGSYTGIIPL